MIGTPFIAGATESQALYEKFVNLGHWSMYLIFCRSYLAFAQLENVTRGVQHWTE